MKHFYKIEHKEFLNGIQVVKYISGLRYGEKTVTHKTVSYTSFEDAIEAHTGDLILGKTFFKKKPYLCSSYQPDFHITKDIFKEYKIEDTIIESNLHTERCSLARLAKVLPADEFIDWLKDSKIENQLEISVK